MATLRRDRVVPPLKTNFSSIRQSIALIVVDEGLVTYRNMLRLFQGAQWHSLHVAMEACLKRLQFLLLVVRGLILSVASIVTVLTTYKDVAFLCLVSDGAELSKDQIKSRLVRSFETYRELQMYADKVRDTELCGHIRTIERWGGAKATLANISLIRGAVVATPFVGAVGYAPDVLLSTSSQSEGAGV